jgi:hypothetical protein
MNRFFTILFSASLLFLSAYNVHAQNGIPHTFLVTAATPPAFPTTGQTNIVVPAANIDEWTTMVTPVGFSFVFAGQTYTQVVISTNGWCSLIPASYAAIPPVFASAFPNNLLANNTTGFPICAPLWDDLSANVFTWNYTGGALWIRWNVKWDKNNLATATPLTYVKLDGTNNTITFYYANNTTYVPSNPSASIGIAGVCAGDYYSVRTTALNAAYVDSTSENPNIGQGGATTMRPYNCSYTFTPYCPNDNCGSAVYGGTIASTCTNATYSTINATAGGFGNCSTSDVKDVWVKYYKPVGVTNMKIITSAASCQSVNGTSVEVYNSCAGIVLACGTTSVTYPNFAEVTLSRPCAAETLYVRVTSDLDVGGKFQMCIKDNGVSSTTGMTCANATPICAIPFSQTGLSTAGFGNDYDSANSACHDPFMNGEDYLFSYTPPSDICIRVQVTSTGLNPGIFVFDGCPNVLASTHCIASSIATTGTMTINSITLQAGTTYYFLVDNDTLGSAPPNIPFNIDITQLATTPSNDACGAVSLGSIANGVSCNFTNYSTECATPSTIAYPVPSCGSFIQNITGDIWLSFTAGFTGVLLLKTQAGPIPSTTDLAMAVYSGTCASLIQYACDDNSAGANMPLLSIPVINGTTYYIRLWTVAPGSPGNFQFCMSSACAPPNDLPCQAINIPLGGTVQGTNACSGSGSEPPNAAQCVAGGIINTVWYKAIVPASGMLKIRTHTHTLSDTQIQAYRFASTCTNAASVYTSLGCNDDGPDCGSGGGQSWHDFSELSLTGLTPGDTVYVAVDGYNSQTGTFEITIIDGSQPYPPVPGADCGAAVQVCGSSPISVPDPGILGYGNICDFATNYNCWNNPERNSAWYQVTVNPGTLQFDVQTQSDYDFIMWDITGVANPCSLIQNIALPSIRCNWVTTVGGHTGISIPDPDASWEPAITVTGSPHTFLINIDNWNPNYLTTGYTLDWMGSPIATSTTSVTWQGSIDTSYSTALNWGTPPCNSTPNCGIDATIATTANGRYPTITTNMAVNSLTINVGATLRIKAPAVLDICGNLTNNGTLICEPGSKIRFVGTGLQTVNGSLTGSNSFANLDITKASGSVQLNTNIDVAEDFVITNATSIYNFNGKYMKVAGDFTNFNNATTTGLGSSTLEFNGSINQVYTNTAGTDDLNRVKLNKTGGSVSLNGAFSTMNIDSVLTLLSGNIVTGNTLEVNVKWGSVNAIVSHNFNSYVEGRLRRKLFLGSIDWPVGSTLVINQGGQKGYELANVTFTSSTVVTDLLCWFSVWPAGSVPNGPLTPAYYDFCAAASPYTTQYDLLPILNNGYWTFQRSVASFNGAYNLTLFNTGGNNASGTYWSVAYAPIAAAPMTQASWGLLGSCVSTSTMGIDKRNQINNPVGSGGSSSFNHLYAAVQSTVILPVELLYFTAEPKGEQVICRWETASETNNDYFIVERSTDGNNFEQIGKVSGFGQGTSTSNRSYSVIDPQPCSDIRYYRLKQVDMDSKFAYSETVAINCKLKNSIEVYPNPAKSELTTEFAQAVDSKITISLIDVAGRVVHRENAEGVKGINVLHISLDDIAAGAYYITITSSETANPTLQTRFFRN